MEQKKQLAETPGVPENHLTRCIRLYWIYSGDYFLGGGPCPVGKEDLTEGHLKFFLKTYPDARIEWETDVYTYLESYAVCRDKAEAVQREQPGVRRMWNSLEMSLALARVSNMGEVIRVKNMRREDAEERTLLGTNDQKVLDAHRGTKPGMIEGEIGHAETDLG